MPPLRASRLRLALLTAALVLACGLGAYPAATGGELVPVATTLALLGVAFAAVAVFRWIRVTGAALACLAGEFLLTEAAGKADRAYAMMSSMHDAVKILLVEDDENLRRLVAAYLEREGYEIGEAADGAEALIMIDTLRPHLVVLDLMLPKLTGLEVAHAIRATSATPILMLTARSSEDDMLRGFEAGADDYLVKPFSPKVLVARVQAILRRSGHGATDEVSGTVARGHISIDLKAHEVHANGRLIDLTATEFDLLRVLAEHPGWVYTREELLESVWGYTYLGDSRLVDMHVANLRKKLEEDPANPRYVRTVRGVGYKFQASGAEPAAPDEGAGA
jgi:DNA-binding response OmpR family regulator